MSAVQQYQRMLHARRIAICLLLARMLAACVDQEAPRASMTLNLVGYNRMADGIANFDVQIKGGSKTGGGFLDAGSGGGGMICCISVPEKWQDLLHKSTPRRTPILARNTRLPSKCSFHSTRPTRLDTSRSISFAMARSRYSLPDTRSGIRIIHSKASWQS